MRTHDTDRVREYATHEYVEPARNRGESTVRIVAGDVHRGLGFHNRIPLVCSALRSGEFLRRNRLKIESQEGPPSMQSTTVAFTYLLEDIVGQKQEPSSFYSLRGIAKEVFRELGGGETFLKADRAEFDTSMAKREER